MTFFSPGGTALGASRAAGFSNNGSRADVLGRRYQPFANPFFDHASTYTPPTVKSLFGFCRFYHLTHGIINAIGTKSAEYPVTDLVIQHEANGVVNKWEELLLGVMNYRVHQFEINLDYYVYGNCFVSPSFPFRKKLTCDSCNAELDAIKTRPHWRYIGHRFWLTCPKCGQSGYAKSKDHYFPQYTEMGLIRWNPENVHIFYNESTGRLDYAMDISPGFRSQIMMGRKDLVATTPEIFLEAVKTKRSLVFDKGSVFHMRRPGVSSTNRGWGIPLLMPVLKDAFYMQVMKKAQESVLLTHLIPQIFLFPQPATAGADPFTTVDLRSWRAHIRRELGRQRIDPAYYGILPFPLGHQVIGENGRSLLLMPEIQQIAEQIAVGMGFPIDLVFGNGNYAGTSVSMRMLENFFLANVHAQYRLLHWVMKRFAAFLNWPTPEARFKPFKMADDLQRQAMMFQMNNAGKVSDTTLLSFMDLKVEEESKLQVREYQIRAEAVKKQQILQAEIQADAAVVMAKGQARAQQAMMDASTEEAGGANDPFAVSQGSSLNRPAGVTLDAAASALAEKVRTMAPEQRDLWLSQLQDQSPEMAGMVEEQLLPPQGMPMEEVQAAMQPMGEPPAGDTGVDMRPLPEQLPPRRGSLV